MITVGGESSSQNKYAKSKVENWQEFVSPFLKNENENEIITVYQREPTKKSKVYLVQEETSLTGRNYIYCSGCQHRAFKQFRNVYRASAPEHLKKYGNSDNDLLKFCRNCWFDTKGPITEKHDGLEPSPHFERSSLGITDRRACFGWHFIQRDFARKKFEEQDKSRVVDDDGAILLPLATVVVQNGNDFIEKIDSGSLFDSNGRETSSSTYSCNNEVDFNAESAAEWRGFVQNQQRQQQKLSNERKLLEIVKQIRKDHDYAPSVQKEIEITTTGLSPEKKIAMKSHNKLFNRDFGPGKNYLKIDKNGQQVKKLAKNLISKTQECSTASNEEIQIKMPIEKAAEEIRKMREKGDAIDPAHLVGLKATSNDGQTLPGLICPLCGKHTVKSYSVWRKNNAPERIQHLFKDGITVIRACRKCVPYPINREKEKSKNPKHAHSRQKSKNNPAPLKVKKGEEKLRTVAKNPSLQNDFNNKDRKVYSIDNLEVKVESLKGLNGFSIAKGQVIPIKGDIAKGKGDKTQVKGHVTNVKGQVTNVKGDVTEVKCEFTKVKGEKIQVKIQRVENADLKRRSSSESSVCHGQEVKKAKLEEEKRKLKIASGQDLTGLECFELLPTEEDNVENSNKLLRENSNSSSSDGISLDKANNNNTNSSLPLIPSRGRPSKSSLICSKCESPLEKSYKTLTMAKCPKRLLNLFDNDVPRKTLRLCKKCLI